MRIYKGHSTGYYQCKSFKAYFLLIEICIWNAYQKEEKKVEVKYRMFSENCPFVLHVSYLNQEIYRKIVLKYEMVCLLSNICYYDILIFLTGLEFEGFSPSLCLLEIFVLVYRKTRRKSSFLVLDSCGKKKKDIKLRSSHHSGVVYVANSCFS